jgi:MraZ protein
VDVLLGEFEQRLDEKNRVTIPARVREPFRAGVYITRGIDRCLSLYSPDGFTEFVDGQKARLDAFSREGRNMERYLYGGGAELELDNQGRVALPAQLIRYAALDRDIVIAGVRDRLEIWNRDAWRTAFDEFEGSVDVVAERLARESHS